MPLEPKPPKPLKHKVVHQRKKIGPDTAKFFLNCKEREKILSKLHCDYVLCMYNIAKLSKDDCREILDVHPKTIIIKNSTMLLTESFSSNITNDFLEKFVKNELETIILAMVSKEPMCGIDIKKRLHQHFNVLLSSGTLYPLLHKLEQKGLLQSKLGFEKIKVYTAADRERILGLLSNHMQAKNFLNMFLRSHMQDLQRIPLLYEQKE